MISQTILIKLIVVGAVCSIGVSYVFYDARTDNAGSDSTQDNALIMKAGMFSASSVSSHSNIENDFGSGGEVNDDGSEKDSVSLMGSAGSYRYSRVGKAYE